MRPKNNIQPDLTLADSDSDIPAGVDAFLREFARWTVEDMRKTAILQLETGPGANESENTAEITEFEQEPLLKKTS